MVMTVASCLAGCSALLPPEQSPHTGIVEDSKNVDEVSDGEGLSDAPKILEATQVEVPEFLSCETCAFATNWDSCVALPDEMTVTVRPGMMGGQDAAVSIKWPHVVGTTAPDPYAEVIGPCAQGLSCWSHATYAGKGKKWRVLMILVEQKKYGAKLKSGFVAKHHFRVHVPLANGKEALRDIAVDVYAAATSCTFQ